MLLVTPAKRSLPGQFSTPCHPTRNGRGTGWGREVGTSLVDQRAGFQKRRLEEEKPAFNECTQRPSFRHFQDVPTVCQTLWNRRAAPPWGTGAQGGADTPDVKLCQHLCAKSPSET